MCCITVSYFPLRFVKTFVLLFSVGLVGCAGFSLYWAVKAKKMLIWLSYGNYLPQNLSDMSFFLGIVLGCLMIFLSILGILLVSRAKHCVITCPVKQRVSPYIQYGSLTFIAFSTYYLLGILCLAAGFYGSEAVTDYCFGQDLEFWYRFKLFNYVKEIDKTYLELDKQLLCTEMCPCLPLQNEDKFYPSNLENRVFNNRTGFSNVTTCLQQRDYSSKWDPNILGYLGQLEKTYRCTGLCRPLPLHLFTSMVDQPSPNLEPCFVHLADELDRDMGKMGYVFLSCGTFVFCAWFCQFGLCCRDKKSEVVREHLKKKRAQIYAIELAQTKEIQKQNALASLADKSLSSTQLVASKTKPNVKPRQKKKKEQFTTLNQTEHTQSDLIKDTLGDSNSKLSQALAMNPIIQS